MKKEYRTRDAVKRKKLIRVVTTSYSLALLLKGQLRFLSQTFETVAIAADSGELDDVRRDEGVECLPVPMRREISFFQDCACLFRLIYIFIRKRPYIVHANTPKGSLLAMVAAKMTFVPHRIYSVTGLRFQGVEGPLRFVLKTMERVTCQCANKIIAEGEGVKQTLMVENITKRPVTVLHHGNINGVNLHYFYPGTDKILSRETMGLDASDFIFLYVGRMVHDKGIRELLLAMKAVAGRHKNAVLLLVGNMEQSLSPLEKECEDIIQFHPQVRYAGFQKDVRPFFRVADVFVHPSHREGFPNVVLQAGAMCLPSIVTDVNGSREIVREGENGWIVPIKDAEALEKKMEFSITHQEALPAMSAKARTRIVKDFDQKDVWNALREMYLSL